MGFNSGKFKSTTLVPREKDVPVPELKEWFDGDDKEVVWRVKSLNYLELNKADAEAKNADVIESVIAGLKGRDGDKLGKNIRDELGLGGITAQEYIKRKCWLMMGSVDPVCDEELAVKLAHTFGGTFLLLTSEIVNLSARGYDVGKSKPSGRTRKSKSP